jgi:hypothetical protein
MKHFRFQKLRGLYLVVSLFLVNNSAPAQSAALNESETCTLVDKVGDICLGPTATSAAHAACSKVYVKDCTNSETNDGKCTRRYKKDQQGNDEVLCAYKLISELNQIPARDRCGLRATEALILRQEINDLITTASLQVDGFVSEIDSETGQIRAVRDNLSDQRDSAVSRSTLGSAVGTGGGAVGSSLALARKAATAGNWVGAVFGGVGTIFGFLGWYEQPHGPKGCFPDMGKDGGHCRVPPVDLCQSDDPKNRPLTCSPSMLFHLVFPDASLNQFASFHSDYDLPIQKYLANPDRGGALLQSWLDEVTDKAAKKKKKKKVDVKDPLLAYPNSILEREEPYLFTSNAWPNKVSIDDLNDRANKLSDLRSVAGRMNRDLSRLTETLAAELQCVRDEPNSQ